MPLTMTRSRPSVHKKFNLTFCQICMQFSIAQGLEYVTGNRRMPVRIPLRKKLLGIVLFSADSLQLEFPSFKYTHSTFTSNTLHCEIFPKRLMRKLSMNILIYIISAEKSQLHLNFNII